MAELTTIPTSAKIAEVVRQIALRFRPHKIILFGSHAGGSPTADSDVDLLVVMETHLRSADQAAAIREAVDFPFPTDLLVRTPRQIADRTALGDVFVQEVLTKGVVLYEAPDPGMG